MLQSLFKLQRGWEQSSSDNISSNALRAIAFIWPLYTHTLCHRHGGGKINICYMYMYIYKNASSQGKGKFSFEKKRDFCWKDVILWRLVACLINYPAVSSRSCAEVWCILVTSFKAQFKPKQTATSHLWKAIELWIAVEIKRKKLQTGQINRLFRNRLQWQGLHPVFKLQQTRGTILGPRSWLMRMESRV